MNHIAEWDRDPVAAFSAFVRSIEFPKTSRRRGIDTADPEPISEDSAEIYTFMFQNFASWMKQRGQLISTVDGQALYDFLDARDVAGERKIHSRIAHRYLRLLERCYEFLQVDANPAKSALLDAARSSKSLGRDLEMSVMKPEHVNLFIAALPNPADSWKRHRDHVMQLAMLKGGLTVAEVIGLQMAEVDHVGIRNGTLMFNLTPDGKHQSSYAHEVIVRAPGAEAMVDWLAVRRRMPFQGHLVFPTNFRGDPLDKATVYRQVKATYERAGLIIPRSGGRSLRNTFAVQELEKATADELREHLGLALKRSTEPYQLANGRLKNAT